MHKVETLQDLSATNMILFEMCACDIAIITILFYATIIPLCEIILIIHIHIGIIFIIYYYLFRFADL